MLLAESWKNDLTHTILSYWRDSSIPLKAQPFPSFQLEHIKHDGIVAQQHCSLPTTPSNISKATTFFEHETEHAELSKNQSILLLLQKNTCKSLIFLIYKIKLN